MAFSHPVMHTLCMHCVRPTVSPLVRISSHTRPPRTLNFELQQSSHRESGISTPRYLSLKQPSTFSKSHQTGQHSSVATNPNTRSRCSRFQKKLTSVAASLSGFSLKSSSSLGRICTRFGLIPSPESPGLLHALPHPTMKVPALASRNPWSSISPGRRQGEMYNIWRSRGQRAKKEGLVSRLDNFEPVSASGHYSTQSNQQSGLTSLPPLNFPSTALDRSTSPSVPVLRTFPAYSPQKSLLRFRSLPLQRSHKSYSTTTINKLASLCHSCIQVFLSHNMTVEEAHESAAMHRMLYQITQSMTPKGVWNGFGWDVLWFVDDDAETRNLKQDKSLRRIAASRELRNSSVNPEIFDAGSDFRRDRFESREACYGKKEYGFDQPQSPTYSTRSSIPRHENGSWREKSGQDMPTLSLSATSSSPDFSSSPYSTVDERRESSNNDGIWSSSPRYLTSSSNSDEFTWSQPRPLPPIPIRTSSLRLDTKNRTNKKSDRPDSPPTPTPFCAERSSRGFLKLYGSNTGSETASIGGPSRNRSKPSTSERRRIRPGTLWDDPFTACPLPLFSDRNSRSSSFSNESVDGHDRMHKQRRAVSAPVTSSSSYAYPNRSQSSKARPKPRLDISPEHHAGQSHTPSGSVEILIGTIVCPSYTSQRERTREGQKPVSNILRPVYPPSKAHLSTTENLQSQIKSVSESDLECSSPSPSPSSTLTLPRPLPTPLDTEVQTAKVVQIRRISGISNLRIRYSS